MATASVILEPFVSIEEYLRTVYEPDMDYVDGVLEDRNVGEFDHSMVQRMLLFALARFEDEANVVAIIETRTQTQLTRFRVPDVSLLSTERLPDRIVRSAPLLCIEVMSPEDRLQRMRTKCEDYLRMGVPLVWIFDVPNQTAYRMTVTNFSRFVTVCSVSTKRLSKSMCRRFMLRPTNARDGLVASHKPERLR